MAKGDGVDNEKKTLGEIQRWIDQSIATIDSNPLDQILLGARQTIERIRVLCESLGMKPPIRIDEKSFLSDKEDGAIYWFWAPYCDGGNFIYDIRTQQDIRERIKLEDTLTEPAEVGKYLEGCSLEATTKAERLKAELLRYLRLWKTAVADWVEHGIPWDIEKISIIREGMLGSVPAVNDGEKPSTLSPVECPLTDGELEILQALDKADRPMRGEELAKAAHGKDEANSNFKAMCASLVKRDVIGTNGKGPGSSGYFLKNKGRELLQRRRENRS